ncbi:hypothetical protein HUN39_16185 [Methylocystis sp. FS]|uniref:hypothetical protein n=1 Tax=Methylocystis TaxID=133 RepID=UPI001581F3E7|nr:MULTISPECIES: hypothetical protein [Methylocystis]MBG0800410.1 hypothetical protein [Methylocystis sp. H4A]NUJ81532.1 hypothetical protein [Methylocystis silviterrae]
MRLSLGVAVAGFLWVATAGAVVPVIDPPREGTEKSIADCMKKARVYKDQTLEPSKGITKSHNTPGSAAGSVPPAGGADVSGSRADASGGSLSNMDLSNLTPAQPTSGPAAYTPQSLNLKTSAQTVSSLQNMAPALASNTSEQRYASLAIGALPLAQGAWDQNSQARSNNGALWNQLIMAGLLTTQLVNQRNVNVTGGSSYAANIFSFDPARATFVDPRVSPQ